MPEPSDKKLALCEDWPEVPRDPALTPSQYFTPDGVRMGWRCPNCGRIYAPSIAHCAPCNRAITEAEYERQRSRQ